ncbi:putative ENT domain, Agenet-like domain, Agenet domain, plant type, ENT domain-like superfamily [Dioscorea sansibarensis]
MRLTKGKKVEVLNRKDLSSSFWQPAEIISGNGRMYQVKYYYSGYEERVSRKFIRPCPPPMMYSKSWMAGDVVDAFVNDSWAHAEVLKLGGQNFAIVRILGTTRVFGTRVSDFRLPQSWEDNKWIVVHKKPTKCTNIVTQRWTKPTNSSQGLSFSLATMESRNCSHEPFLSKRACDFDDAPGRISKRLRSCLPPYEDCTGSSRKVQVVKERGCHQPVFVPSSQLPEKSGSVRKIRIVTEGKRHLLKTSPSAQLLDEVDSFASPGEVLSEKFVHPSLNNNVTAGLLEENFDWMRPNEDKYFILGSLDLSDSESVGSCSVNNIPRQSAKRQKPKASGNVNIQDGDVEVPFRSASEFCVSHKDKLAAKDHRQELDAYRCTITALHASGPLSWENETLLTNLRLELHISNDEHLSEVRHLVSSKTQSRHSWRGAIPMVL